MLAEIALLERFSIYLGHPIYSLGVCLFSLILPPVLAALRQTGSGWTRGPRFSCGARSSTSPQPDFSGPHLTIRSTRSPTTPGVKPNCWYKQRATPATIKPSTEIIWRSPLVFAIATMVERASGVTNHTGSIKRKNRGRCLWLDTASPAHYQASPFSIHMKFSLCDANIQTAPDDLNNELPKSQHDVVWP